LPNLNLKKEQNQKQKPQMLLQFDWLLAGFIHSNDSDTQGVPFVDDDMASDDVEDTDDDDDEDEGVLVCLFKSAPLFVVLLLTVLVGWLW
jgi:hypothetical protein